MKLSKIQKEVLLRCSKKTDWCAKGGSTTMRSLVDKGLAKYTSGFGWKYGLIIELTQSGKDLLLVLNREQHFDGLLGNLDQPKFEVPHE
jgi:hypothetical protein